MEAPPGFNTSDAWSKLGIRNGILASGKHGLKLGCCRFPSKKFNFLLVKRKYEGNPKS